jgi:hypothetical protein
MSTTNKEEKGLFERLGEILNTPLPGTNKSSRKSDRGEDDNDSVLDRIREILSQPLPGTELPEKASKQEEEAVIESENFGDKWWDRDWEIFKAHQDRDRQAFNQKQRQDQEAFARYQEQERTTFDNFQRREFEMYQQHQRWKMQVWQSRMAHGDASEPPPWGSTSSAPASTPFRGLPPWLKDRR